MTMRMPMAKSEGFSQILKEQLTEKDLNVFTFPDIYIILNYENGGGYLRLRGHTIFNFVIKYLCENEKFPKPF